MRGKLDLVDKKIDVIIYHGIYEPSFGEFIKKYFVFLSYQSKQIFVYLIFVSYLGLTLYSYLF